jgi:hypothetical protein
LAHTASLWLPTRFPGVTIILLIMEGHPHQEERTMVNLDNHRLNPTHRTVEIPARIRPWLPESDREMRWIGMKNGEDRHLAAPTRMTRAGDLLLNFPVKAALAVATTLIPLLGTAHMLRLRLLLDRLVDRTVPVAPRPPYASPVCLPHKVSKHLHPR